MARAHDPAETISALRGIVEHHQHAKVQGTRVDATTARAIIAVYDKLSPENQGKFARIGAERGVAVMASMAWKLVSR